MKILEISALIFSLATALWIYPEHVAASKEGTSIQLTVHQGQLSIAVQNAPLAEVLAKIRAAAGFEMIIYGELNQRISRKFTKMPLSIGIRRLLNDHSTIIIHGAQQPASTTDPTYHIAQLWVFGAGEAAGDAHRTPATTPANNLQKTITQPDPTARIAAVQQSAGLEPEQAIPLLRQVLEQDESREVRSAAVGILAAIGGDAAAEALAPALGDPEREVRQRVIQTLGLSLSASALPLLGQALLSEAEPELRLLAVRLMATHHSQAARAFLNMATQDKDSQVRDAAASFLAQGFWSR